LQALTERPQMALEPAPAKLASGLPGPGLPAVATTRELAELARFSVAPMTATPATVSLAQRSQQMSLEKVTCSYFGPVADQVATDTGQFDRFEVISSEPLHHGLERRYEIENQAAVLASRIML
jgi:hypothetical protein